MPRRNMLARTAASTMLAAVVLCCLLPLVSVAQLASFDVDPVVCDKADPLDCYPRHFRATHEFTRIREGQELPPGLHVKMDMTTGEKWAKKMSMSDQTNDNVKSITIKPDIAEKVSISAPRSPSVLVNGKEEPLPPKPKIRATVTSLAHLRELVDQLSDSSKNLKGILSQLEDLVHDADLANELTTHRQGAGFQKLKDLTKITHTSDANETRAAALLVLGSALQNNPNVQSYTTRNHPDLMPQLLHTVAEESVFEDERKHALYALSAYLRGSVSQMHAFINPSNSLNWYQLAPLLAPNKPQNVVRTHVVDLIADLLRLIDESLSTTTDTVNVDWAFWGKALENGVIIQFANSNKRMVSEYDNDVMYALRLCMKKSTWRLNTTATKLFTSIQRQMREEAEPELWQEEITQLQQLLDTASQA